MTMISMMLRGKTIMTTMMRTTIMMLIIWMWKMMATIMPKSIKCFLPMLSSLNSKNISKPPIKWLPFLKDGVSFSSGSSAGMSKGSLTTSMMYTNTNCKYNMIPNSINQHLQYPLIQGIVKFAAIKTLLSTKISVLMPTVWNAGNLISKPPSNPLILSQDAWDANVLFFSRL